MFEICCAECGEELGHTPTEKVLNAVKDSIYCDDCAPNHAADIPDDEDEKDGSENAEETAEEKETNGN